MKFSTYVFIFFLFLSPALFSCAEPETEKMDVAQVRKSIEEVSATLVEAFNRGDAASVAALYTDNASVLPPNSKMVQGRQSIQEFWNDGIQMGLKDLTLTAVDVGGSGDTAYEIGKYTLKIQPEGQESIADSGKSVVVWKQQADGMWKLHVDIWNSSLPMPGME